MVTIRKWRDPNGAHYKIDDFSAYVCALREKGIEPPQVTYQVDVTAVDEQSIRNTMPDWEDQIALFFNLGSSAGIPYQIVG